MSTPSLRENGFKIGPYGDFHVTAYGADPTGVADSSSAIQAAITAAQTANATTLKGATVYFPPGKYLCASPLNAQASQGLRFEGSSGIGAGFGGGSSYTPGSTIIYSGTGATSFLQLNSSFGSVITKLAILYSSASFTGVLIDYDSTSGADATYNIIDECLLGSTQAGAWNAKALVSWNRSDFNVLKNSHLQGAKAGVRFRETSNDYANANRIEDCLFRDFQTGHIMNAGNQEVVSGCVFEGNTHQGPPTSAPAYTTDITTEGAVVDTWNTNFSFVNNSIEDYPAGATQFDTSPTSAINAYGLRFEGNFCSDLHFASLKVASISNNGLGGTVTFDASGTYAGVRMHNNVWYAAPTYANFPSTGIDFKSGIRNNSTEIATVSAGSGAGTGPTLTITGDQRRGTIQVVTGTSPVASGTILTVAFTTAYPVAPVVQLFPMNAATSALTGTTGIFYVSTVNNFSIACSSGALGGPGGTYKWAYVVSP